MEDRLKKTLRAISLETRHILEGENGEPGDLEQQLNRLGIWRNRSKPIEEMPHLSTEDREARRVVDAYLDFRQEADVTREDAVAEFIRESAYTWANRLFALRIMEARGIIDEVILKKEIYGGRSLVHNRFAKKNPMACQGEDDGLIALLFNEFQLRSKDLPDLFNPEAPATKLWLSVAGLKRIIALLSGLEKPRGQEHAIDEIFEAPDAFGWMYQYWNQEEKDKVFEKLRSTKGFKIQGSDIIPTTQLYTEPYMVKFLVQNSLGATWMSMHPESKLFEKWEYYVRDADRASVNIKPISEITFMDPACGSGHFHIEAFDLFYDMYLEEGPITDPKEICTSILEKNLFGIDIDDRAVQIAKAVLWMKVAEIAPDLDGSQLSDFKDHIIATNIQLPKDKDNLESFLKKHPDDEILRPALEAVFNGLENVAELGSLVQIEEPVNRELRSNEGSLLVFGNDAGWDVWKRSVILRIKSHLSVETHKADSFMSFFSYSFGQGLSLIDLLSKRYDIVATNPPYMSSGNMGYITKKYIESHYNLGKRDLYSAFILRCIEIAQKHGRVAMVTQQSWMFLDSFIDLRAPNERRSKRVQKCSFNGLLVETSIETLAHLGTGAFEEIVGEVVNIVLFTLSNVVPSQNHSLIAFRLTGSKNPSEKKELLKFQNSNIKSVIRQEYLLEIDGAPLIYYLNPELLNILIKNPKVISRAVVRQGMASANNPRFVRLLAEVSSLLTGRWANLVKAGRFSRWAGLQQYAVDWAGNGARIKLYVIERYPYLNGNAAWVVKNEETYFRTGWTYSQIASGSLGFRYLEDSIYSHASNSLFPINEIKNQFYLAGILNSIVSTYFARAISQKIGFETGHIEKLPLPVGDSMIIEISHLSEAALIVKQNSISTDVLEYKFQGIRDTVLEHVWLDILEGCLNYLSVLAYGLSEATVNQIVAETGKPVGWLPLIKGYDALPLIPVSLAEIPAEVFNIFAAHERKILADQELISTRIRLHQIYSNRLENKEEIECVEIEDVQKDADDCPIGAFVPIPVETFIEELSQKLQIHPVSIYWLLKEGIDKEGWRCIPEEQQITKDRFSVTILRHLGHRWPKQIEAGEPLPDWADKDGIIPLTEGCGERTLLERVRERMAEDSPGCKVQNIEHEFEEIMGTSLEKWLAGSFFKHHISQFKKRPIAWQIESKPPNGGGRGRKSRQVPAFSCLVYYHKLDGDLLHKIRTQYVWNLRDRFQTEFRTLEKMDSPSNVQLERLGDLRRWIEELKDFDAKLDAVSLNGFDCTKLKEIIDQEPLDKWTSRDGQDAPPATKEEFYLQEKRYDPDINDGVRVNVAPLQIAGILSADVLAKKDLKKAIQDRAEWRADERRWCRQGKLPRPGWWKEDGQ